MPDSNTLFDAIAAGDTPTVRRLVRDQPSLAMARDRNGVSAVLHAHYRQNEDIIDALLQARPGLDLFDAAAVGDSRRLTELLHGDSDIVFTRSADGWTALHLAAFFGRADAARLLLQAGADPRAVSANSMANTPLHAAAAGRHLEVCKLLLQKDADPNARQHGGYTALQSAALHGDRDLVDLLLCHGADASLADDEGKRPADFARDAGHAEIAELLSDRSAS